MWALFLVFFVVVVERMRAGSGKDSGSEEAKRGGEGCGVAPEFRSPLLDMAF